MSGSQNTAPPQKKPALASLKSPTENKHLSMKAKTKDPLQKLEAHLFKILKIRFRKKGLLEAAFTHPSYKYEKQIKHLEDFDRLEFFGDTILNFVICKELYRLFPKEKEGMLSRLRSILVSRKILSRIARASGFLKHIRLGDALKEQAEFSKDKVLCDSLEAFLAALFFDRGFKTVEMLLLKLFRPYLDIKKLFRIDPNPKSTLQELCQKKWQRLPIYESLLAGKRMKTVVSISPRIRATAYGKNRKESEERAARDLIRKIRSV